MPHTKIFTKDIHNATIQRLGYAKVPFLNGEEIKLLVDFFYANHPQLPPGMYSSSHSPDFSFRQKMNEEIKRVCKRAVEATFKNVTPLGATFMVKSRGENGSLHPHQDWSIVDETQFNSYNIWLPLVDVNEQNGTLMVLPYSHNIYKENIRGLNIPSSYEKVEKEIWQYLVAVNVKAGEALVYDHRLLHASGINKTSTPRLVIVYGIIPDNADMRYYYGRDGFIEEYDCTPDFYFNQDINSGPSQLRLLSQKTNDNLVYSLEQLSTTYNWPFSFFKKIARLFS